jgi:small basic protein
MRILVCSIVGLVAGFVLGFTTAASTPLNYPGFLIAQLLFAAGFAPSGDAGFIIYCWGILLQWLLLGLVVGLVWQWRFKRSKSPNQRMQ